MATVFFSTELKIFDRQNFASFLKKFRFGETKIQGGGGGGIKQIGQVPLVLYILKEIFDGIPRPQRSARCSCFWVVV